jgi:mannitol/fructose-specific phosphotransferase system IIA component (Ntr-type)
VSDPIRPELRISALLEEGLVEPGLRADCPEAAIERLLAPLLRRVGFDDAGVAAALECVHARERTCSTVFGTIAIPHARLAALPRIVAGLGLNADGVWPGGPRIVLAFASPAGSAAEHLRFLAGVAQIFRSEGIEEELLRARDAGSVRDAIVARQR